MNYLGKKESTQKSLLGKLSLAKEFIDNNLTQEYTVPDIAKEATLSQYHFYRCFKETFGLSPYQYYLQRKMKRSAELMRTSDLALTDIALQLGFSELATFSKRFKKIYGIPPLQYKKNIRSTDLLPKVSQMN